MKKYLFIALAALGFAACADKNEANGPVQNAEMEESYIAINLMAADSDTRAAKDEYGYEDGTDAERAVKTAYFFFFDENGNPFNMINTSAPGGDKNHLPLDITPITGNENEPVENVSDISKAVLILNTYKGIYPKQIVAVLNWNPADRPYTLEELQTVVVNNSLGNDTNGYVMSNSVYSNGTNIMAATPITADNIKTSENDALAAPVEIYVERTAAKVVVTNTKVANNRYAVTDENGMKPVGGTPRTVYVELLGWELYNEFDKTNLVKSIENWDSNTIGLTWNDSPFHRSYWAQTWNERTTNDTFAWSYIDPTSNGLPTEYGYKIASEANYTDRDTYTYCGENTLDWKTKDVRTKVILKGRLVEDNGNGGYQSIELAQWYGNEYAGVSDLKTAVANSLKYTLYYYDTDGGKHVSIAPEHIEIVHGSQVNAKSYEVGFQLSNEGEEKIWFKYNSEENFESFGDIADGVNTTNTNEYLKSVKPAVLYTDGDTYYIVDIEHLGADDTTTEYGVVRNHVYQIDIQSIKGYGSPGYSSLDHIVDTPEYPVDDEKSSFVAAKINILSWKVVKQGVNIEQ